MPKVDEDVAVIQTSVGKIVLMFYPEVAPKHVENFKALVSEGFFNGTRFHRCIPGFMIQGGDPKSKNLALSDRWGTGGRMNEDGTERLLKAEFNTKLLHDRGVLSMARSASPDSASSQFFIMTAKSPSLDNFYTSFGRVVQGMDVVDKIVKTGNADENGAVKPSEAIVVEKAEIKKWPL